MYYLTEYTGVNVNKTWFIVLWILVFITELAIPPIPGGSLICIGILLNQFGIPTSCIGIAATLFLIFDFFTTSSKTVILHMEEVLEADHHNILNVEVLRKS